MLYLSSISYKFIALAMKKETMTASVMLPAHSAGHPRK